MKPTECPECEAEFCRRPNVRDQAEMLTKEGGRDEADGYVNRQLADFHDGHVRATYRAWLASMGEGPDAPKSDA